MKPTLRLRASAATGIAGNAPGLAAGNTPGFGAGNVPGLGDNAPDLAGVAELRQQALLALEQTREARRTGEIEKAATETLNEIETSLAGLPEAGPPGVVTARVVASGDSKVNLPAIPLAGLTARLKVGDKVVQEEETNAFGLVDLELPKDAEGSYEIEVLGPSCNVLVCQRGRWNPNQPAPAHRIELARSAELKPQLERSAAIEEGIKQARSRAELASAVVAKALEAQEKRLVEYLGELDDLLKGNPGEKVVTEVLLGPAPPREPAPPRLPLPQREPKADKPATDTPPSDA
jgi:hypothetical protein